MSLYNNAKAKTIFHLKDIEVTIIATVRGRLFTIELAKNKVTGNLADFGRAIEGTVKKLTELSVIYPLNK